MIIHGVKFNRWRDYIYLRHNPPPGIKRRVSISLESLIIPLIVAGLVGVIGQRLAGSLQGGLLTSIALGFIGAFLGTWGSKQFRLPELLNLQIGRTSFPIIWAIIGATVFVALLGLLTRRRYV